MILVAAAFLALAAPASAQTSGWDGSVPFNCVVHQAGFEATAPEGAADDPYCVEFDKRRQNVSQLGVVDFLSKEPARVAAAGDKCFYYQRDHWRGSVVQDDGSTKTYEWDGSYFYDRARGEGGAYVTNFNANGRTEDPSAVPGMPPEYAQHMGPGTGGVRTMGSVEVDPSCVAKAASGSVYARPASETRFATSPDRCRAPAGGRVTTRGIGPVRIRMPERDVRAALGPPAEIHRGFLRYCAGGGFLVGQRGDRSGDLGGDETDPTVMVVATAGAFTTRRISLGRRAATRTLRRRGLRRVGRLGSITLWSPRRSPVILGVRRGRAVLIAVRDPTAIKTRQGIETYLRRALVT